MLCPCASGGMLLTSMAHRRTADVDYVAQALKEGLYTRVVGRRILYLPRTSSTMDEAERLAREGAPEGTIVVAEEQSGGRGRFGRVWTSPPGNLYLSVLLRPPANAIHLTSVAACVAVVRAIRRVTHVEPRVKWPNDVLLRGRKVAGILVEGSSQAGEAYQVVGMGINVTLDASKVPELSGSATSLAAEVGEAPSRTVLLRTVLHELDALYNGLRRGQSPVPEWRRYLDTLGKQVEVRWGDQSHNGLAVDVDERGSLVLTRPDGSTLALPAGEVTLRSQGRSL